MILTESSVVVRTDPDMGDAEDASGGFAAAANEDGSAAGISEADAWELSETTMFLREFAAAMSSSTAVAQLRLRNQTDRRPELRAITEVDFSGLASAS